MKAVHALQKAVRIDGIFDYTGEYAEQAMGIAHTQGAERGN